MIIEGARGEIFDLCPVDLKKEWKLGRMLLAGDELLKIRLPHGEDSQLYLSFPHEMVMEMRARRSSDGGDRGVVRGKDRGRGFDWN
jgi:hypothetical protein